MAPPCSTGSCVRHSTHNPPMLIGKVPELHQAAVNAKLAAELAELTTEAAMPQLGTP